MGHPLCPKRGGVGIVDSRQGDTCTVLILDEPISGCIPLTSMPPVGAIVEVEMRCDLAVILDWTAGEPAQPQLGGWYFDPVESPGWVEGDSDSPFGVGERVGNVAPVEGPGILWNTTEIRVRPGDVLTFAAQLSLMDGGAPATAQLVFCFAEYGGDPQPSSGETIGYGTPTLVDGELIEFDATATVPSTFGGPGGGGTAHTPGAARLGILFDVAP